MRSQPTREHDARRNFSKRETWNACCYQQSSYCLGRVHCVRRVERRRARSKKYDTGATDTEIKIGNIMPYSGPASAYGIIGKTEAAYFKKINDAGGINGRKINFISYDD